jgi:TolB protein
MKAGHSPAWSPDGNRIAFVSPENKICMMDADGGHFQQLTTGDSTDATPVWTPSGKYIVYASQPNQGKSRNYDIMIMNVDGTVNPSPLTSNGSYDAYPAVSSDGKYVYFFSNRNAQSPGQEALQIWRLELPADYLPVK